MLRKSDDLGDIYHHCQKNLNISNLVVTQGSEGATLYNKKSKKFYYMEAFASKVVDKIGSGDTMLSLISICGTHKSNLMNQRFSYRKMFWSGKIYLQKI